MFREFMPPLDWNDVLARLQPGPAETLFFGKDGRQERVKAILAGGEAPEESFYGFLGQLREGRDARMLSTSTAYTTGLRGKVHRVHERLIARLLGISMRNYWLDTHRAHWGGGEMLGKPH